ncbi:class I SAM-dependent methyltransferase [Limibaculum sp. M0105]|uniref:Class I SAM-dependent methyltransferase n=1 Tax=Thermohalobaculum xanthum TaxID=2753746 RepID=A0A8J7M6W9_9RHOB|nr:methyltransferase domain-containing protein [Thermohalobaculum xanthum]MBK0399310.1 class I SAM-dependent methyltransferase [Thermohalobaculum xanthum]
MTEPRQIHDVEGLNQRLQAITRRARVDLRYLHDDRSRAHVAGAIDGMARVLDVGAGMRGALTGFTGKVETLDLNDIDATEQNLTRPDLLGDVCSPFPDWMAGRYDAVIALAILEHVYDPAAAVANFRGALKPGGRLFLYVPWMWRYHAPRSLVFQDYQRLSRDGMAYLLRDFDEVTLYPLRGKYSAILNMLKWWKPMVERRLRGRVNRLVDARASDWRNTMQASGFFAEAVRPAD